LINHDFGLNLHGFSNDQIILGHNPDKKTSFWFCVPISGCFISVARYPLVICYIIT
jgi:hypothetical protein